MNLMDLIAKISLDSQDFDKGLDNSKSKFSGFGSAISSGCKTIAKVGVSAFVGLGTAIGGATTALLKNASATAQEADAIDKNSQKLGMSTTAYQEWDFVLQHCGSSVDSLKGGMKTMNKSFESSMEVINATSEAEAELERQLDSGEITFEEYNKKYDELYEGAYKDLGALGELGFSMMEIEEMAGDSDKAFAMIVEKLQQMPEGAERTALATDLLGKSAQELAPLLNMSAEETQGMIDQVHELGGVMEEDAVKAGAKFQDSLTNLKTTITGAKNNLMGEFLPSLTTVMDGLTKLFSGDESGLGMVKQGIEEFAQKLSEALPKALETLGGIAESLISALPSFFDAIAQQLPSLIQTLIPVLINAVVGLASAIERAIPQILSSIQSNIGVITSGLTKIITSVGKIILKLVPVLLPMLIQVGLELIQALAQGFIENADEVIGAIFTLVDQVVTILTEPSTLSALLECGLQIILALAQGILNNLPQLLGTLLDVFTNVVGWFITEGAPMILNASGKLFESIGEGLLNAWDFIVGKIGEIFGKILGDSGIGGWGADILSKAQEMFENIGDAIGNAWETVKEAVTNFGSDIWNGIKDGLGDLFEKGKELVMEVVDGIKSVAYKINEAIWGSGALEKNDLYQKAKEEAEKQGKGYADSYVKGQEEGYDINSPSKKMKYIGEMVMAGFAEGIEDESDDSMKDIETTFGDFHPTISMGVDGKNGASSPINELITKIDALMAKGYDITVPVFIGYDQIDEQNIKSSNRVQVRSGGQV